MTRVQGWTLAVLFTATSMVCAAAQSIAMLNVARAAQGVGGAAMFAVSLAVLSHAFPRMDEHERRLPPTWRRRAVRSRSARWSAAR
jgi:MFS family permease